MDYFSSIKDVHDKTEVETILVGLNLQDFQSTSVSRLSNGHRRLLQIALALLGRPKALIIDGALDGLDAKSTKCVV